MDGGEGGAAAAAAAATAAGPGAAPAAPEPPQPQQQPQQRCSAKRRRAAGGQGSSPRQPQPQPPGQRREPAPPLVTGVLDLLAGAEALRVDGPQEGYRNKITYSIRPEVPQLQTTTLACERCNSLCRSVHEWAARHTGLPPAVWHEVSVKVNRGGAAALLKLTVVCDPHTAEHWAAGEGQLFVSWLRERHPCLAAAVYQRADSAAKPGKEDAASYRCLYGDGSLLERGPSGAPYRISADSFCEVNHFMEDRIWALLEAWLPRGGGAAAAAAPSGDAAPPPGPPPPEWDLLLLGRDSNPLVCGLFPAMRRAARCRRCICLCHCPRVVADLRANVPAHCCCAEQVSIQGVQGKFAYHAAVLAAGTDLPLRVVVNAGRGGMAPDTVAALAANPRIEQVVCFSCNPGSLAPDAAALWRGGFGIANYRALDFFPGTEYLMQAVDFRRPAPRLLLPVGPPGAGKSTLCNALCSGLPRGICRATERDAEFARCRSAAPSLAKAKQATHAAVCAALREAAAAVQCVLYDSTNGDASGRDWAFGEAAAGWAEKAPAAAAVICALRPGGGCGDAAPAAASERVEAELVRRCLGREGHPAFPSDAAGAAAKVRTVSAAVDWPQHIGPSAGGPAAARAEPPGAVRPLAPQVLLEVDPLQPGAAEAAALCCSAALWLRPELLVAAAASPRWPAGARASVQCGAQGPPAHSPRLDAEQVAAALARIAAAAGAAE
eukprot:TRINITY_DN12061_c0_g1_i1.p1 TRINITY_DN12061_c0_g1~~TRINITY_DN12061_c0_g1_i1.p1  ORF type:complete len:742 (+),score=217.57 TRINITY_DN12061_c0_g1_i1:69-2228(+)